jgi:ferredoxin
MCATVCPHGVLVVREGVAEIAHLDGCMECGACANNCPSGAIEVETGVGCAAAVINSILGRTDSSCCCVIEKSDGKASHREASSESGSGRC